MLRNAHGAAGDKFVPFGWTPDAYHLVEIMGSLRLLAKKYLGPFPLCGIFLPALVVGCSTNVQGDDPANTGGQTNAGSGGDNGVGTGGATSGSGGSIPAVGGAPLGVGGAVTDGNGGLSEPGSGGASDLGSGGASDPGTGGSATPDARVSTIIPDPSWDCGAAEGMVPPEMGELVFEATLPTDPVIDVGETPYGQRRVIGIREGDFTGTAISGKFLTGGIDFELTLENASVEMEQVAMLRTSDGSLIYLRSCGVAAPGDSVVRFVPDFEIANSSSHAWLNTGEFLATREFDAAAQEMKIAVYDVSGVTPPAEEVQLQDPPGTPHQPWECATSSGSQGAMVFTETVTLGASLSVGQSKRGNRNVIPITGGTVTGQFQGIVVPGGADYQLLSGGATLDARYTLKANDGEYLIVRNCGAASSLVPQFEARVLGAYNFLNEGEYLSSGPGSAQGGVSITFYEAN